MQFNFTMRNWNPAQVWSSASFTYANGTFTANTQSLPNLSVSVAAGSVHLVCDWAVSATNQFLSRRLRRPLVTLHVCPGRLY